MTTFLHRLWVRRRSVLASAAALPFVAAGLAACGGEKNGQGGAGEPDLKAEMPRADPGPAEGAGALVVPFTARMLAGIDRADVNAVCSPLSAQIGLTMIGLGAAGDTRTQIEDALGGSIDELAQSANTLSSVLASVGADEREDPEADGPEPAAASLANSIWLQEGMEVQEAFLEGLATSFGSGIFEADFADGAEREQARERINDWVAGATHDLIQELIPEGLLASSTRLVLVNALHLRAAWPTALTRAGGTFTTAEGEEMSTEMLTGATSRWYEDDLCRATALDTYGDELALALVQPDEDLATVLDGWSGSAADEGVGLTALLRGLEESDGATQVTLPGFDIEWGGELNGLLAELGMVDAFGGAANFSGITGAEDLLITDVVQKAVITVDDEGMEAAAATAVVARTTSAQVPEQELVLDSPFLFVAYEKSTLAPLVIGWIGDPTQTR